MLTGEEFRGQIRKRMETGSAVFTPEEVDGISPKDFPSDAKIFIEPADRTLGPGQVRQPVFWTVNDQRFVAHRLLHGGDHPKVFLKGIAFGKLVQECIVNRAAIANDVKFDGFGSGLPDGITWEIGYQVFCKSDNLRVAYHEAIEIDRSIVAVAWLSANRLENAFDSEVERIKGRDSWKSVRQIRTLKPPPPRPPLVNNTVEMARAIFEASEAFRDAGSVLQNRLIFLRTEDSTRWLLESPAIVNSALACELALKCLLCLRRKLKDEKPGHQLKKQLLECLDKTDREKISRAYESAVTSILKEPAYLGMAASDFDLNRLLEEDEHAFVLHRYRYEGDNQHTGYRLQLFQEIVRITILDENPDWTYLRSTDAVLLNPHASFVKRQDRPIGK